jgi:K+-sensing histidine kinase KdpD
MAKDATDSEAPKRREGSSLDHLREALPAALRYLLALVLVAAAFGLRTVALPREYGPQFLTFYPAVALSFYLAGPGPGVLAILASALLGEFFFVPPYFTFEMNRASLVLLGIFVVSASAIGYVLERVHSFSRSSIKSEKELFALALREKDKRLAGRFIERIEELERDRIF